jgi:DNA polymerase I-like protein with 3'-5' exonuclease and polymerase domains
MTANKAGVVLLDPSDSIEPKPKKRAQKLSPEERAERLAQRKLEQAAAREAKALARAAQKEADRLAKIAAAEGGKLDLPAVVMRNSRTVRDMVIPLEPLAFSIPVSEIRNVLTPYLDEMCLDVEHSGYDFGHGSYELRTVQLGGYEMAVVLDSEDPDQMAEAGWALKAAKKLRTFSATADNVPSVMAGLVDWDEIWNKTYDVVLNVKLTDPRLANSHSEGLKDLARGILGDQAVAPAAEKAKKELFKALGCVLETDALTPPSKNGWFVVDKRAKNMIIYAGSDVLDLAGVAAALDPALPVSLDVLERERRFEAICARIAHTGYKLNHGHIKAMIDQYEAEQKQTKLMVQIMTGGLIGNPSSPDVGKKLIELHPRLATILERSEKTGEPSAAKKSLSKIDKDDPEYPLTSTILKYRHCTTTLGLLLRPLEILCSQGDGRMRPTVLTINADTGRSSCVRPNGQQFSRQGRIRESVEADDGYVMVNADFQGCEIRVAAGLSGDKQLLEAELSPFCYRCERDAFLEDPCSCGIKDGELKAHSGLHWLAAHLTFGMGAEKENRYKAKAVIFRKLFGGAPDSEVAQKIANVFDTQIAPEYAAWDKWLRKSFYDGCYVWRDYSDGKNYRTPIEGTRRGIYRTYSGRNIYIKAPHAFGNYAIQGTARELLVDGVLKWDDAVRERPEWRAAPLLPVHDECLTWVKREYHTEATEVLRQCMATTVLSTPDWPVEIGADPELQEFSYWPDSS